MSKANDGLVRGTRVVKGRSEPVDPQPRPLFLVVVERGVHVHIGVSLVTNGDWARVRPQDALWQLESPLRRVSHARMA